MERMEEPNNPNRKQLADMFDLTGDKRIAEYVARFEDLYRQREAVNADLKETAADASEGMFTKRDIDAMKKIAKWRVDDKVGAAQELMTSLRRVAIAVKIDLFAWADKTT